MPITVKQPQRHNISSSNINNKSNCSNSVNGGFRISSFPSTNKQQNVVPPQQKNKSSHNVIPPKDNNNKAATTTANLSHQSMFQVDDNELNEVQQQFTESDIILNKKLLITEIEGNQLNNRCIIINCASMVNGKRNKKDGSVIFGLINYTAETHLLNDNTTTNNNNNNDFTFMLKPNQINSDININIRLFIIYFSQNKKKYFIRTYHTQSNSNENDYSVRNINEIFFIRIIGSYQMKGVEIFMIGDLVFVFRTDNDKLIITKVKNKNTPEDETKTFGDELGNTTFTIGRNSNCSFAFPNNKSLSKVHCSFKYFKLEKMWVVYDGSINSNKKSTNGIWLIPKKSFEVYNEMEFKILGCSRCQIKIKD